MRHLGFLAVVLAATWATSARAEENEKGEKLWKAKCAQCHGIDGKGQTKKGKEMGISDASTAEWQKEFTDQKIKDTLSTGVKRERNGKKQVMDPLGKELEPAQFDALIAHIRSLRAPLASKK